MRRNQLAILAAHGINVERDLPEFASCEDAIGFGETLAGLRDCEADDGVGFKLRFTLATTMPELTRGVVHFGRYGWISGLYRFGNDGESFELNLAGVYNDVLMPYDLAGLLEHLEIVVAAGLPVCTFFKLLDALVEGTLGHPLVTEKRNNDVQRCFIDLVDKIQPGVVVLERLLAQQDPHPGLDLILGRLQYSHY